MKNLSFNKFEEVHKKLAIMLFKDQDGVAPHDLSFGFADANQREADEPYHVHHFETYESLDENLPAKLRSAPLNRFIYQNLSLESIHLNNLDKYLIKNKEELRDDSIQSALMSLFNTIDELKAKHTDLADFKPIVTLIVWLDRINMTQMETDIFVELPFGHVNDYEDVFHAFEAVFNTWKQSETTDEITPKMQIADNGNASVLWEILLNVPSIEEQFQQNKENN